MSDTGTPIGEVFVRVSPDLDGFRIALERDLQLAMRGLDATVPVGADLRPAEAKLAALRAEAAAPTSVPVGADTRAAAAALARLRMEADAPATITVEADVAPAEAALAAVRAEADTPAQFVVSANPDASFARVVAEKELLAGSVDFAVHADVGSGIGRQIGDALATSFTHMDLGTQIATAIERGLGTGTTYNLGEQIAQGIDRGIGTGTTENLGAQIASAILDRSTGAGAGAAVGALGDPALGSGVGAVVGATGATTATGQALQREWAALTDSLVAEIEKGSIDSNVGAGIAAALDQAATHFEAGMIEDLDAASRILAGVRTDLAAAGVGAPGGSQAMPPWASALLGNLGWDSGTGQWKQASGSASGQAATDAQIAALAADIRAAASGGGAGNLTPADLAALAGSGGNGGIPPEALAALLGDAGGGGGGGAAGAALGGGLLAGVGGGAAAAGIGAAGFLHITHMVAPMVLGLAAALATTAIGFTALGIAAAPTIRQIALGAQAVNAAHTAIGAAIPGTTQWTTATASLGNAWSQIPTVLQPAVHALNNMLGRSGTQVERWVAYQVQYLAGRAGGLFTPLIQAAMRTADVVEKMLLGGSGGTLKRLIATLARDLGPDTIRLVQLGLSIGRIFADLAAAASAGAGLQLVVNIFRDLARVLSTPIFHAFLQGWSMWDKFFFSLVGTVAKGIGALAQLGGGFTGVAKFVGVAAGALLTFEAYLWLASKAFTGTGGAVSRTQALFEGFTSRLGSIAMFTGGIALFGNGIINLSRDIARATAHSHGLIGVLGTVAGAPAAAWHGLVGIFSGVTKTLEHSASTVDQYKKALNGAIPQASQLSPALDLLIRSSQQIGSVLAGDEKGFATFTTTVPISFQKMVANLQHQNNTLAGWAATAVLLLKQGFNPAAITAMAQQAPQQLSVVEAAYKKGGAKIAQQINVGFEEQLLLGQMSSSGGVLGFTTKIEQDMQNANPVIRAAADKLAKAMNIPVVAYKGIDKVPTLMDAIAGALPKASAAAKTAQPILQTFAEIVGGGFLAWKSFGSVFAGLGGMLSTVTRNIYINIAALGEWALALIGVQTESIILNAMLGVGILGGIALLVVGIYELVKHWKTVWGEIKRITGDVVDFLHTKWGRLLQFLPVIGPIVALILHWKVLWHGLRDATIAVWDALKTAWRDTSRFLVGAFDTFKKDAAAAFHAIASVLDPIFHAIWDVLKVGWIVVRTFLEIDWALFRIVTTVAWDLIKLVFVTVWDAIAGTVRTVWKAISGFLVGAWRVFTSVTTTTWHVIAGVFTTVWHAISSTIHTVWGGISSFLVGAWRAFTGVTTAAWDLIKKPIIGAWDAVFGPGGVFHSEWTAVSGWLAGVWRTFTHFVGGIFGTASSGKGIVGTIAAAWQTLPDAIRTVWNDIGRWVTQGVNDVIGIINGFIGVIDSIETSLGIGASVQKVPLVGASSGGGGAAALGSTAGGGRAVPLMAAGGRIGGGFVTDGPRAIVGEGRAMFPEFVIPTDPAYRDRAVGLYQALGTHLLAGGGILGTIGSAIGSAVGSAGSLLSSLTSEGASAVLSPFLRAADSALAHLGGPIGLIGEAALNTIAHAVLGLLGSAGQKGASGATGAASSVPANAVASLGQQMAAARGWTGAQWVALNDVAMRESGWNMTAKNPGSGAYGVAQFINGPGEYAQYGGNVNTAVGQVTAFLNYIAQRYGNPAGAWAHELSAGWYESGGIIGKNKTLPFQVLDQGGFLPPGLSMAYNGLGRPEPVGAAMGGGMHVTYAPTYRVAGGLSGEALAQVEALDAAGHEKVVSMLTEALS